MELTHESEVLRAGGLEVRPGDHLALVNGRALALSVRELELLAALVRRKGRIVPREELYATVWGAPLRAHDRSVDVYVHKLRSKLGRAVPECRFIHTHFGFGYRFEPEPSHPFHRGADHQPEDGYR
jgi:DNA-binding response OmpR family regulator